jgi:hypothetical protein
MTSDKEERVSSDLEELTKLNHDYVASVQNGDVKRFDEILRRIFIAPIPTRALSTALPS